MNVADVILGGVIALFGLLMMSPLIYHRRHPGPGYRLVSVFGMPLLLGGAIRCAAGLHASWATYERASHAITWASMPIMVWMLFSMARRTNIRILALRVWGVVTGICMCMHGIFAVAKALHVAWADSGWDVTIFEWTVFPATAWVVAVLLLRKQGEKGHAQQQS